MGLAHFANFLYPVPLKLRDLQDMVRPFIEVQSTHHIPNLDAVIQEITRGLLRLHGAVRAWDECLAELICVVADATPGPERVQSILDICSAMEMDRFEAAHRLGRLDGEVFQIRASEIETICQRLPLLQDIRLVYGPPTLVLDHGDYGIAAQNFEQSNPNEAVGVDDDDGVPASMRPLVNSRRETQQWWREQGFVHSVPTTILASAMLAELVDAGTHPDKWVADSLPHVLERIFGVQITQRAFMNRFLPKLGGFVDSYGEEVPVGTGLTFRSKPARAADTLLTFLRQWAKFLEEDSKAHLADRPRRNSKIATRASSWEMGSFLGDMMSTGHGIQEVEAMLHGDAAIPDHVLKVPQPEERYRVSDEKRRMWELATSLDYDLAEPRGLERDLGPYVNLDLNDKVQLAEAFGIKVNQPHYSWCLVNPEVALAARSRKLADEDPNSSGEDADDTEKKPPLIDGFALSLVEKPKERVGDQPSTFLRFFSEEGRQISCKQLQGLPPLPWTLGTDPRCTIIMDLPTPGIAPFHCLFCPAKGAAVQGYGKNSDPAALPCIVPLGHATSPTYIVCPKYQPLKIRNGDRLICHHWTFELHVKPTGVHTTSLTILTDEGTEFEVPIEGCHIGAGFQSRHLALQPTFPRPKFALDHRLANMAPVHVCFHYQGSMNSWVVVDHSPDTMGTLLALKTGVAYPVSEGLRIKMGDVMLEVGPDKNVLPERIV